MLRDYQIEICERVREAFARHRSVMVQMPTGTGKTVVLAELVREYLNVNLNGGRNVLIVAHRRELVEQIQQALLRVMGAEDESSTSFGKYPSFRSLASKKGVVTEIFLPHPSSPARRGSTSPSAPPPQEGAPTAPRRSAHNASARLQGTGAFISPRSIAYATKLRLFDEIKLRVFMRRGRGCATWGGLTRGKTLHRRGLRSLLSRRRAYGA